MKTFYLITFFIFCTILSTEEIDSNYFKTVGQNTESVDHNCLNTITLVGSVLTEDTQVLSSRPNNNFNYSVSNTVYSWTENDVPSSKYILINFDWPEGMNSKSKICLAYLSLYFNPTDPYEPFDFHYGTDNGFIISRTTQSWNPATVTWNTKPSITSVNEVTLPAPTSNTQDYTDIDVRFLVKDMFSNNQPYGFQIRMKNPNYYRGLLFGSSTNPNSSIRPKLVLAYDI